MPMVDRNIFCQYKNKLTPASYQIRSAKGIQRYWQLMSRTHFICVAVLVEYVVFCQVLFPEKSVEIPCFRQGIFPTFGGH